MFFLYDLYYDQRKAYARWESNPMSFGTREGLLRFLDGTDPRFLNVTGKDTMRVCGSARAWPAYATEEREDCPIVDTHVLRPFVVMDGYGRHVDPRNWPKPGPEPRKEDGWPCAWRQGAKSHEHRANGPSMWRHGARCACEWDDPDGLEPYESDAPRMRHASRNGVHDLDTWFWKRGHRSHWADKSWKNCCKAQHQYMKHKDPHHETVPERRNRCRWQAERPERGAMSIDGHVWSMHGHDGNMD